MSGVAKLGLNIPDLVSAGSRLPIVVASENGDATLPLSAYCVTESGDRVGGPVLLRSDGGGRYFGEFELLKPGASRVDIRSAVPQRPVEDVSDWTLIWDDNQAVA
jgi:hypothetical protein